MSNRIYKYKKESFEVTALCRSFLLRAFSSSHFSIILSYYNYIIRSISSYRVSESDSNRRRVYILVNRTGCDVLKVIKKQLINFAA